jgi:LuxR family maltose regulon positive regulatory protein
LLHFLLVTSILERMCGELCEALLPEMTEAGQLVDMFSDGAQQTSTGRRILEGLERRNLFVVPLDNRRHWYRYHHLFAELLRHHLQINVDAATIADLHRRAADWCANHGLATEAVNHALSAEDSDLTAELIEGALAASATWSGGEVGTWQAWWRALPASTFVQRPLLCLRISRALYLAGHIEEAEHLLDEGERALKETPDRYDNISSLQAQAAVHRAAVSAMRGEIGRAIDETEGALRRLGEGEKLMRARATTRWAWRMNCAVIWNTPCTPIGRPARWPKLLACDTWLSTPAARLRWSGWRRVSFIRRCRYATA